MEDLLQRKNEREKLVANPKQLMGVRQQWVQMVEVAAKLKRK
jgi:hypothetical protein